MSLLVGDCDMTLYYINVCAGCQEGRIRLAGGRNALEGRVEVCHEGVWGTVCNTRWSEGEAMVACRQLGHAESGNDFFNAEYGVVHMYMYVLGALVLPNSAFGQGSGPIFLDNLMCTGREARLVDCPHAGFEMNSCNHDQDGGLRCEPGMKHIAIIV